MNKNLVLICFQREMETKEVRHARNAWIELAESPSAASGLSPMSVLAADLGAASLLADATLRRRLSLNSQTASPAPSSPLLHKIQRPKGITITFFRNTQN